VCCQHCQQAGPRLRALLLTFFGAIAAAAVRACWCSYVSCLGKHAWLLLG
jgi:hypothetical protein